MKNFFKSSTPWTVIIGLILLIIIDRSCNKSTPDKIVTPWIITTTDTVPGDSVPYAVFVPKPYPVRVDCVRVDFADVDTLAILQAYYMRRIYQDTLKNDTSALVVVMDTVMLNSLQSRRLIFQNRRPTQISHTTTFNPAVETRRAKVFVGPSVGRSLDNITVAASAMLVTKNDAAYALSYDIFNKDVYFTMYWKISFRRARDALTSH